MRYLPIALLLGLFACAQATKPLPDKNTNWLKTCDADAQCGSALACSCGTCTKPCDSDAQCKGASCLSNDDPGVLAACGARPTTERGSCSVECERDSDCNAQAKGLRCSVGVCVPETKPPVADEPARCTPGEVSAQLCLEVCPLLSQVAVATCTEYGHYGACSCQEANCAPIIDCRATDVCFANRCIAKSDSCYGYKCEPGAECQDRICVKVLVDGLSSPGDIGIGDDGSLYFVNTGTYDARGQFMFDAMLARVPLTGGPYERLREDLNEIGRMIVVDDAAYWFNVRDGNAFQVTGRKFATEGPASIFLTDHAQSPLVADDRAFYWLERKDPNGPVDLMSASRAGLQPEPQRLLTLPEPATALTQLGDKLYWGSIDSGLWRGNKDGSASERIVQPDDELRGPAVLATHDSGVVWYWTRESDDHFGFGRYATDTDRYLSLTPESSTHLGEHFALDDEFAYFVYSNDGKSPYVLGREGKVPDTGAAFWSSPHLQATSRMLMHEGFLYFTSLPAPGQGKIMRLRIPQWLVIIDSQSRQNPK